MAGTHFASELLEVTFLCHLEEQFPFLTKSLLLNSKRNFEASPGLTRRITGKQLLEHFRAA
jgi:hypothetical protein